MSPSSPVIAPLAKLARARRKHARGIAIAGILAAVLVGIGLLSFLDIWAEWRPPVRMALAAILGIGAFVILAKRLRKAEQHDAMEAARVVEEARPELGQKLRTALEVSKRGEQDYFSDRLLRETERELELSPCASLVPRKQLWQRRLAALAGLAALVITASNWGDFSHALKRVLLPHQDLTYTKVLWRSLPRGYDETHPPRLEFEVTGRAAEPELLLRQRDGSWKPVELTRRSDGRTWDVVFTGKTDDLQVKVVAGDARQDEKTIAFRPIPKLIDTLATVKYPDYTGLKDESVPGGDVRSVEGSTAEWLFTFDHPPAKITWSVAGSEPVELSPQGSEPKYAASAEMKVGKVQAELAIFHADGERIDGWRFEIEGVVDKLPVVEIVEPTKDLELIGTAELPIRFRAKDDFGVAEIGLILDIAGERKWVVETVIDEKNQRQVSDIAKMMLDQIPLKITDNVRIHAYALDHKPRGGPRAVSALRSIDIRQFQMRWYFASGEGGEEEEEEGPDTEAITDAIMKLDEIIKGQRSIISDVFGTKESYRGNLTPEAVKKSAEHGARQQALGEESRATAMEWAAEGQIPADDVALMGTAADQMSDAGAFLDIPDLVQGFNTGDRALSTLLQLRKELITIIGKGKKPGKPSDAPPIPLAELAKEARRIAGEEKDVASQIAPEAAAGNDIDSTRRQQEVALADTGELFAKLVDHPERNEGALRLMDDAEKSVAKADRSLNAEAPGGAEPDLAKAERDLLDFAIFMEAMDLQKLSDTLRNMADNAEKAAGEQQGEEGEDAPPSPPPGEGSKGQSPGEAAEKAARETELAKKILEELEKKAGQTPENAEGRKPASAAALDALKERIDPGQLAKELEKLAQLQKDGSPQGTGELGANATRELGAMARELRDAAASLDANRLAELNKAREQAEALKKELAATDGQKPGEGQKPGKGEGEKPGEGKGEGEMASKGEGEGKGEGDKPGQGQGDKPGEGQGQGETASKDGKGEGGSGGGDKPGRPGAALDRFADSLDRLADEGGVGRLVMPLRAAPFDRRTVPLVDAADQRLKELIDQIPSDPDIASARGKLPEESRREIEDYFRDLSDDFGGEEWEQKQ